MTEQRHDPIGVILAGGIGRRIGGSKAIVELHGVPLISYPLSAMKAALRDVAIVAKPDTELPRLSGVTLWIESATRHHPILGVIEALELAAGRPVVVCAVDFPFVTPEVLRGLATAAPGSAPAVVAAHRGRIQPLLACYQPVAAEGLRRAAQNENVSMRDAVASLEPRLFEIEDPDELFNVNGAEDLLTAAAMLDSAR